VLNEDVPEPEHDFLVGVIVTPERVIWCSEPLRPVQFDWSGLSAEQIAAIPVLGRRRL
jgi:5-formyltetrahydrofolate cyclo-ligase